jgi:hypothetical protein
VIDRCYDFRGDGVPVVLIDGEAAGTWQRMEVELFDTATKTVRRAIDSRLDQVRAFLDS